MFWNRGLKKWFQCLGLSLLTGFSVVSSAQQPFENVTVASGLGEAWSNGASWANQAAWGDYDDDGHTDVMIHRKLYRNNGDGTFSDVSPTAVAKGNGVWGDYDNDGLLDFYRFQFGGSGALYRNQGDGTFSLAPIPANPHASSQAAAWGDADRDGHLDLYVANHEVPGTTSSRPDLFYQNRGDGIFDIAWEAPNHPGRGVNWADYDNDGDADIQVSVYRLRDNLLWANDGFGRFENLAETVGVAGHGHSISSSWGDLDNDGDLDLVTVNLSHNPNTQDSVMVLMNSGAPDYSFTNINLGGAAGIFYQEAWAKGALADYDNDGFLDLALSDVAIFDEAYVFRGLGDGTFELAMMLSNEDSFHVAWGDYNGDGFMDLINAKGLWRNQGNNNNWLKVRVIGDDGSNRGGIGARVKITADGQSQIREIEGGNSGNQNEPIAHFGLGSYSGVVEVEVQFPSSKIGAWSAVPGETLEVFEHDAAFGTVDDSEIVSSDFPPSLGFNQSYDASVTIRNTGTTIWQPETYAVDNRVIGPRFGGPPPWPGEPVPLLVPVFPGASYTFPIPLATGDGSGDPDGSGGGGEGQTFASDWTMSAFPNQPGAGFFFGDTEFILLPVFLGGGIDASTLPSQVISPTTVTAGENFFLSFFMENTGTTTWTTGTGYQLGITQPNDPFNSSGVVELTSDVPPESQHTFSIPMIAPTAPGAYVTFWRMFREGEGFGTVMRQMIRVEAAER